MQIIFNPTNNVPLEPVQFTWWPICCINCKKEKQKQNTIKQTSRSDPFNMSQGLNLAKDHRVKKL